MSVTVAKVFESTRTFLNDDNALKWTDALLFPKLVQASGELAAKLALNGIPLVREQSSVFTVMAGAVTLGGDLPEDLLDPILVKEFGAGETIDRAVDMAKRDFIPNVQQTETLRYWRWANQEITFLGATADRQVFVRYIKDLSTPTDVTSLIEFNKAEIFLGPRTAALAAFSQEKWEMFQIVNAIAEANLGLVVRAQVKGDQTLPARRRPFSSRFRRGRSF